MFNIVTAVLVSLVVSTPIVLIVAYAAARVAAVAWYRTKREDLEFTLRRLDDLEERECNGTKAV